MSIIALANSKGGCGKSTLAQCLAYSAAFKKKYKRIALVELDRQGTLHTWHNRRPENDGTGVDFDVAYSTNPDEAAENLQRIYRKADCTILDLPGESETAFATTLGAKAADVVLVPIRNSTADLDAFGKHLLPLLDTLDAYGKTFIIPAFVHPSANQAKMHNHFQEMMPKGIRTTRHCFPARKVYEYCGEEGETLTEYAKTSRKNKREHMQARAAIDDIEKIAKEIIKHA